MVFSCRVLLFKFGFAEAAFAIKNIVGKDGVHLHLSCDSILLVMMAGGDPFFPYGSVGAATSTFIHIQELARTKKWMIRKAFG